MRFLSVFLVGFLFVPTAAWGQGAPYTFSGEAEEEVVQVIGDFFHAFAAKDSTGMAQHVDLGGRLVITRSDENGEAVSNVIPMDRFLGLIANREGPPIEETIWGEEAQVMDNLASVWVNYNLWVGDVIDHCGKDNFQLARGAEGWKIIAVADTQRREGCVPVVRQ